MAFNAQSQKIWKPNNFKSSGAKLNKGPKQDKEDQLRLPLPQGGGGGNHGFSNYTIKEL
jgi:hypothetical protein